MTSRFASSVSASSTLAIVAATLLAGCASRSLNPPPVVDWSNAIQAGPAGSSAATPSYTVRPDDTLASIARRFGITPADLANWNNLGPNPRVRPDQVLRVSPPSAAPVDVAPAAVPQAIGSGTVEQRPLGPSTGVPPVQAPSSANVPDKTGPLGVKRPYSDATLAELSRPDSGAGGSAGGTAAAPTPSAPAASSSPAAQPSAGLAWSWPSSGKAISGFADGKGKGIDFTGAAGDPVLAAADGKVTFSGTGVRGYGNFVIIRHSADLLSVYAHNRSNLVKEGALVTKGQKIAEMGSSDADAVKLHFEIRNDSKPVDPLKYLPER